MDWRNSLLVGGATFLVGSVLMEIGDKPNGDIGWWPYVGTFISGAVGFMLLTNEYTPKALELNAQDSVGGKLYTMFGREYFEKHDEGNNEHKYYALFKIATPIDGKITYWSAYGRLEGYGRAGSIVVTQLSGINKYEEMFSKKYKKYDYVGSTIPAEIEANAIQKINEKWPQMGLGMQTKKQKVVTTNPPKTPPKSPPKETNARQARLKKRFGLGAEDGRPKIEAICDKLGLEYYTMYHNETGFQNVHHKSCKHWDMAEANTNYGRKWSVGGPIESIQDELLSHIWYHFGEHNWEPTKAKMKEKDVKTLRDAIKFNNKPGCIKFDFAPCFKKTDKYPAILDEPFDFEKSFGLGAENFEARGYEPNKPYYATAHSDRPTSVMHPIKCGHYKMVMSGMGVWDSPTFYDTIEEMVEDQLYYLADAILESGDEQMIQGYKNLKTVGEARKWLSKTTGTKLNFAPCFKKEHDYDSKALNALPITPIPFDLFDAESLVLIDNCLKCKYKGIKAYHIDGMGWWLHCPKCNYRTEVAEREIAWEISPDWDISQKGPVISPIDVNWASDFIKKAKLVKNFGAEMFDTQLGSGSYGEVFSYNGKALKIVDLEDADNRLQADFFEKIYLMNQKGMAIPDSLVKIIHYNRGTMTPELVTELKGKTQKLGDKSVGHPIAYWVMELVPTIYNKLPYPIRNENEEEYRDEMRKLGKWTEKNLNYQIGDLHDENIGIREDDSLVVFDPHINKVGNTRSYGFIHVAETNE